MKKLVNSIVVTASSHEMPLNGISKSLELLGVSSPLEIEGARICSIPDWIKKASARGSSNPGRALQIALSEIFLANLDNPIQTHWGWADHRNTNLLDFWHEFDDQIRFLLVVESPLHLIARLTLEGALSDGESRLLVLSKWAQSVEKIISFYRSWPDICLLTNSLAWSYQESEVVNSVATWLALDEKEVEFKENKELQDQSLLVLSQFLKLNSEELELVDQLWQQVIALSPSPDQLVVEHSALKLVEKFFAQLTHLKTDTESLQVTNQTKSEKIYQLQSEIKAYQKQVLSLESDREELSTTFNGLKDESESQKDQLIKSQVELKELKEKIINLEGQLSYEKSKPQFDPSLELKLKDFELENESTIVQLHQVQEELEEYFLKFQEAQSHVNEEQEKLTTANSKIRKLERQLKNSQSVNGILCQYDDIQLIRYFNEPGYESIWISLENANIGTRHWPYFEFRLSAANVQPDVFSEQPHYEFPRLENSPQVFENWFAESSDELRGDRFELRFNLGEGAMDLAAWNALTKLDQAQLIALIQSIPSMLDDLAQFNDLSIRSLEEWKALNERSFELIAALVKL
jgi:hypothetical protein